MLALESLGRIKVGSNPSNGNTLLDDSNHTIWLTNYRCKSKVLGDTNAMVDGEELDVKIGGVVAISNKAFQAMA